MADAGELCSQLSDLAELSELPELRSVAELSPVSDLFPDAELCVAELSPMAHLPSADLEAAIELDMLETTRGPLLWTGTAVGGGDSRPLSLRNNSDSETLSVALELADGSVFQFQGDQPGRALELTLPPATERRVPVLFAPPAADCYRDSVLVRKAAQPTGLAAVIPLCGYGGAANIQVCLNTRQPTAGLTLLLNMTAPDGSLLAGLMVANRGPRAAYVRLFVCTDSTCRERVPDGAATALPARCVVAAGETQQLTVAVPPSQPAAAAGLAVSVLCGDEVLRRELRHAWPTGAPALQRPRGFLQLTDFQETFDGELQDLCSDVPLGIPPNKLEDVFFSNMRQTKLPLLYPEGAGGAAAAAAVAGPSGRGNLQELQPAAVPRTVTVGRAGSSTPVSPQRAAAGPSLAPGGSPRRPSASPSRTKSSPRKRGPPLAPPPPPPPPAPAAEDEDWWPDGPGAERVVATDSGRPRLRLSTDHLLFPLTALGVPSEAALQLTNLGEDVLTWNILGYSVPYLVKGAHPDKMKKCGYDVFKIRPKEGEVAPGQTVSLQVRFSPPYPGKLTQHFQLLCKPAKEPVGQPMVVYTVPVRVSGRGSVLEDGEDEADLLTTPLHVSSQSFYFDHWSMCHKLDVTNKTCEDLDVDYHVTGPFKVVSGPNERSPTELTEGRLLAPSQRYVQMSIYFCPEAVGQYTGELRLWLGHAPWSHLVQLGGNCRPGEPEALRDTQLAGGL